MSAEIEINQNFAEDLPSTSLINNNHNNASLKNRSKTDSDHKVHFNIVEDGEKRQKSSFQRDIPNKQKISLESPSSPGFATRLSVAIRRSLRLGPKQRSTAVPSINKDEHRAFRFGGDDKNVRILIALEIVMWLLYLGIYQFHGSAKRALRHLFRNYRRTPIHDPTESKSPGPFNSIFKSIFKCARVCFLTIFKMLDNQLNRLLGDSVGSWVGSLRSRWILQ